MGSGGVHKSLGRFELMILIRRKTGNLRADRVRKTRAFALLLPTLLAWLLPSFANAAIVHEGTFTNHSAGASAASITVSNVTAGTDQLYLISVALYGTNMTVSSVTNDGGLTFALKRSQCSARISQPQVEIWEAFGTPSGTFSVTANISGTATVVSAAVSRYSGADTTTPTEGVAGSTSNGQNGACTGGLDDAIQTLSLTSTVDGSVHYVTTHTRNRVLSSEDADYTQRAYLDNTASGAGGAGSRTPSRGGTMAP